MKRQTIITFMTVCCLYSSYAHALPISYGHIDGIIHEAEISAANTSFIYPQVVVLPDSESGEYPLLSVRKFDPTLGALQSASIRISGWLRSVLGHHADALTGYASSTAEAEVHSIVYPDSVLTTLMDREVLRLSSVFLEEELSDYGLFGARVDSVRGDEDWFLFEEDFVDSEDLKLLSQDQEAPGAEMLSLLSVGRLFNGARGEHSGFPPTSWLTIDTEPRPGSKPGLGTLALTITRILNNGHNIVWSDMHLAYNTGWNMQIYYTYEPHSTEPIPEPSTMLLFGTGLAGLVAVRRRKKKQQS